MQGCLTMINAFALFSLHKVAVVSAEIGNFAAKSSKDMLIHDYISSTPTAPSQTAGNAARHATGVLKKTLLPCIVSMLALSAMAQDIQLPSPNLKQQSLTVVEALNTRHSVRSFDATKALTTQQLSDLCWAACGTTRGGNFRTAPSAMNRQEIRLFAFTREGVFEYDAKANLLVRKASGDHRRLMASNSPDSEMKQTFVMDAPVVLLMVIDSERFGSNDGRAMMMGCVDAGNVSENVNLYCQAVGLATVPRATHDTAGIRRLLGLSDRQLPIMNNPVGYAK